MACYVAAEPHIRDFLVEFLTACGHRVESAGNGSEALTLLTARSFALILTDLHMPEMDGEALYQKIAQTWPHLASRGGLRDLGRAVPLLGRLLWRRASSHPAEAVQCRCASATGRADAQPLLGSFIR